MTVEELRKLTYDLPDKAEVLIIPENSTIRGALRVSTVLCDKTNCCAFITSQTRKEKSNVENE